MIEKLLNPVLGPLLRIHPFLAMLVITVITTLIVTLIYKWMTDQRLMKHLKEETKKYQQEMKKHSNNPKKLLEIQKKSFDVSMKYLSSSLKPTLVTFIPIIIVFAWVNAAMAYQPIQPGQEFTTTVELQKGAKGYMEITVPKEIDATSNKNLTINFDNQKKYSWKLKAAEKPGEYLIEYKMVKEEIQGSGAEKNYKKEVMIAKDQQITYPAKIISDGTVRQIQIDQQSLTIISVFGLSLNWLWSYIILSIIFSLILRKVMNIY